MLSPEDVDRHVERVQKDGYTVVTDAVAPSLLDAIERELARIEEVERIVPASNIFEGLKTVRIYNLLARARVFEQIPVHEGVLAIVERVLDKGCLVSSLSSIAIEPGEDAQLLHADDQLIPLAKPHVPIICNTMWAITDFTAQNGATRVVPGSHRRDRSPNLGEAVETVPAEMARGSVLVFDGSIWHGGGANRSTARRTGVAMNYCSGWMRQQENQQLGIPLDLARGFSDRLRKLCGFGIYRGLIGHIDKCSPADLLDGGPRRPVVGVVR
jgi:ectoine hydroxylase-related dioxygenase (phytanoyl-CoA dioxygenase family)